MRVIRVITRLDVQGGAEYSTLIEVEALAARGHEVLVVTLAEPATPVASTRLGDAGAASVHISGRIPRQALELRRLIRRWRPDVVDAVIWESELVTALAGIGSNVPTVVSLVNMQYTPEAVAGAPSPVRLEVVRRIEGVVLRHGIDHYRCLTTALSEHAARYLGLPTDRTSVIPRGRDADTWAVTDAQVRSVRAELHSGSGDLDSGHLDLDSGHLVVNVGRHEAQKGQELLIEAIGLLEPSLGVKLVIAGRDGHQTDQLRAQIERLGLSDRVELLGIRRDVPALLRCADVVAVSSRYEGVAGAAVEALGAGAAIVAFGIPSVCEVVEDAGVVVEPFDVEALSEAIGLLVLDEDRRRSLSARARQRFESEFELGSVTTRLEGMYGMLATGGR